eukprot:jgi/Tetstr1/435178/TSEL_002634.t1
MIAMKIAAAPLLGRLPTQAKPRAATADRTWRQSGGGGGDSASPRRSLYVRSTKEGGAEDGAVPPPSPAPGPSPTDPVQTVAWGGSLPSKRRMVLGGLTGLSIGLVSNFAGMTSGLLGLDGGKHARELRLDVLFPVGGFKRCLDKKNGFEFMVPRDWLADQTLFRRAAERAERSLDPPSLRRQRPRQMVAEPVAGFGPPGNRGDTNLSVIAAPILPGFRMQDMGGAEQAASRFLETIAPPTSKKVATLVASSEYTSPGGTLYYTMEYTVKAPTFFRHNVSVYAAADDTLFTFNAQCPESAWEDSQELLRTAASSFRLV